MGTPRISVRDYLANQHLWNARREAWLCRKREDKILTKNGVDRPHRSHAMAAVLSAVAFLEAIVNEVWQDAADSGPGQHRFHGDRIPENALATMRELWNGKENAERAMSTLSKFQIALVCAGHDRMDRGTEPYQSVDVLIDLRNALGHFKPQWWHDDGTGTANYIAALRDKLKGRENRQPIGNPWYPNKVLGAGCADWACDSAIAFARDWYGRMGLTEFDGRYVMPSEPVEVDD
jgi:hypothetical protein